MTDYPYNLGTHSYPITTQFRAAQIWFDRGLMWCYGFNHEEAIRCFEKALAHDPECAMAYWGISYAYGPNYNKPWEFYDDDELAEDLLKCRQAAQKAAALAEKCILVEQGIIQSLSKRYQSDQPISLEAYDGWNDDYADALRALHHAHPDDLDLRALFVEAMLNRTPWMLWDVHAGTPAEGADTVEAMETLEKAIQQMDEGNLPPHAGIMHLYIHTMEMSPYPERALPAADALRGYIPDGGHLLHMPSHIDVLCGHYHNAVVANDKATAADQKYLKQVGLDNFYNLYCCHDYHLKMYAAMFMGQFKPALAAAEAIDSLVPDELLRNSSYHVISTLEGYASMKMHVMVRFGKWQEIIDAPIEVDPQLRPVAWGMLHYAKGVANSALGHIEAAEEHKVELRKTIAGIPDDRHFFNNRAIDVLEVGMAMLKGELEYRKENHNQAFDHLRQAVYLDDHLYYTEPWAWMHPPRHALGALLLEQGHVEEAEAVYRADLGFDDTLSRPSQHPDNVWSLHGYVECLEKLDKMELAQVMRTRRDLALARADSSLNSSCMCRQETYCCH